MKSEAILTHLESRRKSSVSSDDFLTTYLADQERVSWESRRKNEGGILTGPQGSLYIYIINLYIPYIYSNNIYTRRTASVAAEKSSTVFPTTLTTYRQEPHQINEITRRSFLTTFHFGGLS